MNASQLQQRTLGANALRILARLWEGRLPPTVRELAGLCGMNINGICWHLRRLRKLGLVVWDEGMGARTLRATCRLEIAQEVTR